jgi:hypothetical protein
MRFRTLVALAACAPLTGCFVFFIPGSLVSKVSDGITGDRGAHCVPKYAKAGDKIKTPDGRIYVVASLSGTSMRCTDPDMPIRAELDLQSPTPAATAATDADRAAACQALNNVKPGAPQAEFQPAWAELNRLGMTWRDCQAKKPA